MRESIRVIVSIVLDELLTHPAVDHYLEAAENIADLV
jgi:pantoate kinase